MNPSEQSYYPWGADSSAGMWQCGTCFEWCSYGNHHTCSGRWKFTATGLDITAEDRIASALERIASALENANQTEDTC